MSDLLGLGDSSQSAADPQRKRAQVLAALLERLTVLARRGPLLMVFEDAQWSDPTSIELFTLTVERLHALPILLIITHRPDFQPPWVGHPHVTTMTLNRLGRRERMAMVEHVTGGKALPAALLEQIVERTDGVPLFVEELTKAVMESEQLDQPAQQLAIPATLQDSLMSRVDRLGSAREVLQIGAAIGREFSYELLAAVAGLPDQVLQDALARLTEAELVFPRGTPPNATYSFKHALVQDAAYSPLLRARRQQLHGAIAQVLEKRFPDTRARGAGAAIRRRRPCRTGDPLLASGRRSRSAPLRHEGIAGALLHCVASASRRCRRRPSATASNSTSALASAWCS